MAFNIPHHLMKMVFGSDRKRLVAARKDVSVANDVVNASHDGLSNAT